MLKIMNEPPASIDQLNKAIQYLSKESGFPKAQAVINAVVGLVGISAKDKWKVFTDSGGKIRSNAAWFMESDGFADRRAAYKIAEGNKNNIDLKAFWMKKSTKSVISWLVALTPNFEDEPFYGNLNLGIDFVIPEKADRVIVILSKNHSIRTLELSGELSVTQQEIFSKWLADFDFSNKSQVHGVLWQSFDIEPLNKRFYKEISSFFIELKDSLKKKDIFDERHAAYFVNRLIGRIVFCWFLQKKGLIHPDCKYFETDGQAANTYYRTKLETLFFKVFNTPIEDREPGVDQKTPFLNGGLFEPKESDKFGDSSLTFPADYFERLLSFLRHYNFTTDESTSTFQQVAIDPEMLGRIFENLLAEQSEETGEQARKARGAFYTPREIVDYMCRESLREYLKSQLANNEDTIDIISNILDTKEHEWRDQQRNYRDRLKKYKYDILEALDNIKIIDPACGSGAFPMGMLALLVGVYERLDATFDSYKKKLAVIKNNLYGVDIEPMAVEICRLRAWLSIVVDEKHIEPLPNLDFKFVCANSLLPLAARESGKIDFYQEEDFEKQARELQRRYFSAHTKQEKDIIHKAYDEELIASRQDEDADSARHRQLKTYRPFNAASIADFFDPEFMFGVSGFDVVIGNPPYVSLEKIGNIKNEYKKIYEVADGRADLYCLFYEMGMRIAKKQTGLLCYITSNKWMRAGYGSKLRGFFAEHSPLKLIDFGGFKVFQSATVDTNILLIKNQEQDAAAPCYACHFQDDYQQGDEIADYFQKNKLPLTQLGADTWFIGSQAQRSLKQKIEAVGTPLKEWDVRINYGIKTGFNEAFIINQAKRDELVAADPASAQMIKPILRGRDIKRYAHEWAGLWVINTHNGYKNQENEKVPPINIEDYPAVKDYLKQYIVDLSKRTDKGVTPYNLRNCAYLEDFAKEKVVWPMVSTRQSAFTKVKSSVFLNNKAYLISGGNLSFLVGILNSKLSWSYFINQESSLGDHSLEIRKNGLENFPIPKITPANQALADQIEALVDQILAAKKDNPNADTAALEAHIDQLVFELYGLTEEEILIVDTEHKKDTAVSSQCNDDFAMPTIIDLDEIKEAIPGYSPEKANEFHEQSAKIANKIFDLRLAETENQNVVLMCGGSASGKSEFLAKFLPETFKGIIFDSTLSNSIGAEIKIKNIKKSNNIPVLCLVLPKNLKDSFSAFCNRERKIPEHRFYETHAGARKTALWVAENFPEIEILVYENQYDASDASEEGLPYSQIKFKNKKDLIDFLRKIQYTEDEIFSAIQ